MPRFIQKNWPGSPDAYGGRAARKGFSYQAFVPDLVGGLELRLSGELASLVSSAERKVDLLNRNPPMLASLEVLARRLLRAESVASSRIEGLELSQRRLARAEFQGAGASDETARSVLGNVAAMERAITLGASPRPLVVDDLLDIHKILMRETRTPHIAGQLREGQNWLGGTSFNPARAEFVPPPPSYVPGLMRDLIAFCIRDDLPPVVQAGVAHAQFETIHPFADGNGRVGRALIHVILRRRGLAPSYVPPVSLVLAADARSYIRGLTAFREEKVNDWLTLFTSAVGDAASKATELAQCLAVLQDRWREQAGHPRRDSAAEALIRELPARPVISLSTATEITGRSKQAANEAIAALATAGVLKEVTLGKRNRAWEAKELFDLINDVERELATPPDGKKPGRPHPRRRKS